MATKKKIEVTKPTIAQLEYILQHEQDQEFNILPDGTLQRVEGRTVTDKPLTFKENLGGEYGYITG